MPEHASRFRAESEGDFAVTGQSARWFVAWVFSGLIACGILSPDGWTLAARAQETKPQETKQLEAKPLEAKPQETWEYSPYKIRVWVATSQSPIITARMKDEIHRTLVERADVYAQATWNVLPTAAPQRVRADMLRAIGEVTVDQVQEHWVVAESQAEDRPLSGDKLILVSVNVEFNGVRIRARELDCRTRYWGPTTERWVQQPERIPAEVFEALAAAFAPITRVESIENNEAVVRLRAGGLLLGQQSPIDIAIQTPLIVVNRRNDRDGEPLSGGIEVVPWTYFYVARREGSSLYCRLVTGLQNPLRGRTTLRTQRYGLGPRLVAESTLLQLQADNESSEPLTGYDIYSKDPALDAATEEALKSVDPPYFGRTDWRGTVEIPKGDLPLRLIYVKNGNLLLAKLPVVPGLHAVELADVRNDGPRLLAEELVNEINSEIVELVTKRNLLAARARLRISEGKLEEARALVDELRRLPGRDELERKLQDSLTRVLEELKQSPDPRTQGKIQALFNRERDVLANFMDPALLSTLERELGGDVPGAAEAADEPQN